MFPTIFQNPLAERCETGMKIVVLDGHTLNPGDLSWDGFKQFGEFTCYDLTPGDRILENIGDAEVVIINKTPIARATLDAKPGIRYVGLLSTGTDAADLAAARERGIPVTNIPDYCTASVAQHVFALLLEACHHVGHHAASVRDGRWSSSVDFCYWDFPLVELDGKTMGLIGYGHIGQRVARLAVAMGMKVLVHTRTPGKVRESEDIRQASLEEVLAGSDVISLHVPLFDSTRGMIDASAIEIMRDGVMVINTARGPLVIEGDMAAALNRGKVGAYCADVVSVEPILPSNPLLGAKNCLLTPHIAWAPRAARERLMNIAVNNLAAFIQGRPVNVVNP